jgi:hypothetical protein
LRQWRNTNGNTVRIAAGRSLRFWIMTRSGCANAGRLHQIAAPRTHKSARHLERFGF